MLKIRVPASSANMGPGFDCMGVALSLYNYIYVKKIEAGLVIEAFGEGADLISKDERNLVFKSMKKVFDYTNQKVDGLYIKLENNIPLSRGLGSSSACIIGGMYAANTILNNPLSDKEILDLASKVEKHPDNITPCLVGGFTASVIENDEVYYIKKEVSDALSFLLMIPPFTMRTKKAREVLPKKIFYKDGVFNIARSTLFALSMFNEDFELFKISLKDKLHEPYRSHLIDGFEDIVNESLKAGALGAYLSGSGTTISAILYDKDSEKIKNHMENYLKKLNCNWMILSVKADNNGVMIL